ncbi:MAG: photosynthetic complex assembly protein [Erythrobacter sp. SCN 62-14]|nr:MAG: photosynthetic complex assembly protein [Erythrobacter sp. SCN 62-14]
MIVREYEKDEVTVHRVPLLLMGGLVLISIILTLLVTNGYLPKSAVAAQYRAEANIEAAVQRPIKFYDEEDGTVRVEDADTGEVVGRFGIGEGGFIRTSVRSLVHQRRIRDQGPEVPFQLIGWSDSSLTLLDPVTDRSVEVANFGPDNRLVFSNMLPEENGFSRRGRK